MSSSSVGESTDSDFSSSNHSIEEDSERSFKIGHFFTYNQEGPWMTVLKFLQSNAFSYLGRSKSEERTKNFQFQHVEVFNKNFMLRQFTTFVTESIGRDVLCFFKPQEQYADEEENEYRIKENLYTGLRPLENFNQLNDAKKIQLIKTAFHHFLILHRAFNYKLSTFRKEQFGSYSFSSPRLVTLLEDLQQILTPAIPDMNFLSLSSNRIEVEEEPSLFFQKTTFPNCHDQNYTYPLTLKFYENALENTSQDRERKLFRIQSPAWLTPRFRQERNYRIQRFKQERNFWTRKLCSVYQEENLIEKIPPLLQLLINKIHLSKLKANFLIQRANRFCDNTNLKSYQPQQAIPLLIKAYEAYIFLEDIQNQKKVLLLLFDTCASDRYKVNNFPLAIETSHCLILIYKYEENEDEVTFYLNQIQLLEDTQQDCLQEREETERPPPTFFKLRLPSCSASSYDEDDRDRLPPIIPTVPPPPSSERNQRAASGANRNRKSYNIFRDNWFFRYFCFGWLFFGCSSS